MKDYHFDTQTRVWSREAFTSINYADGAEDRLIKFVSQASDLSALSEELFTGITDWPSEYHLSRQRHCLIRPLDIKPGDKVLELGCGCGAITRYLGEIGANVVAVEGSTSRASIAAQRCRDLKNVQVVADNLLNFSSEQKFDWVLFIGVLEYSPVFSDANDPVHQCLRYTVDTLLAQDGRLVVAIENQLGLKYLNGCAEDHLGIPFYGINGLYHKKTPVTFGKLQLTEKLRGAGLNNVNFYFPYPDYKLPSVVIHQSGFSDADLQVSELIMRCESRDYTGNNYRTFNEPFAAKLFEQNGTLADFSNSFLVVAAKDTTTELNNSNKLTWVYSCNNRKKEFCTETIFYRDANHHLVVEKKSLCTSDKGYSNITGEHSLNVQHRNELDSFKQGTSLYWQILKSRASSKKMEDIADAFDIWFKEIKSHAIAIVGNPSDRLESWVISGEFVDALPFNYIDDKGKLQLIDKEFVIEGYVLLGWILYRSVFYCLNNSLVRSQSSISFNVTEIINHICKNNRLSFDEGSVRIWQTLEINFQCQITIEVDLNYPNIIPGYINIFSKLSVQENWLETQKHQLETQKHQLEIQSRTLAIKERQLAAQTSTIEAIYHSRSWRITARLRYLSRAWALIKTPGGFRRILRKVISVLRARGWKGLQAQSRSELNPQNTIVHNDYQVWIDSYNILSDSWKREIPHRIASFSRKPLISIIMPVFNPPVKFLNEAICSVRNQYYQNWELCIADDASTDPTVAQLLKKHAAEDKRIKVAFRNENGHISKASNSALKLVKGEYIALLDHDDKLTEDALFWVADVINKKPDIKIIYSDEDKLDASGKRIDPYFKCDWNYDLLLSQNFISHLGVYQTELILEINGFRAGFEGSQDYDLLLRCIEKVCLDQIYHIPRILYHWRAMPGSTALGSAEKPYAVLAGQKAINEHLARKKIAAKAEIIESHYRVRYQIPQTFPHVTLIIPTRNGYALMQNCINSIITKTTYPNYSIIIVDNGSDDPDILDYFQTLKKDPRIQILRDDRPFNYSVLNNAAVQKAKDSIIGLVNNDIEVISTDWMDEMVSHAIRPEIGAVGARLWYPDDTLQHGGVIIGVGGCAGHAHKGIPKGSIGYFKRAIVIQSYSAVTGACLFVRKELYDKVGGLDEEHLPVAFNDIDFCLKLQEQGYRNLWTPYAELYHHESATRGLEDSPEKQARFKKECAYFEEKWQHILLKDPAYSPNLTLEKEDFTFGWPPRIET